MLKEYAICLKIGTKVQQKKEKSKFLTIFDKKYSLILAYVKKKLYLCLVLCARALVSAPCVHSLLF